MGPKDASGTATHPPRRRWLLRALSLLGLATLCYLVGAAVMFFDLPTSTFIRRAFVGGAAWYEQRHAVPPTDTPVTVGAIDVPGKTCDGFTLCMYGGNSRAMLLNMRGDVVHQWHVPFSHLWTGAPRLRGRIVDAAVYFNDGYLYPNGDIVVVIEGPITSRNPSNGFGLAKLDKDSHVLWTYPELCHHDIDVDEDGTIYALSNQIAHTVPAGLEEIPTPCMVDCVDVISPEGERIKRIPLLDAIHDSPFAPYLCVLEKPGSMAGQGISLPRVPNLLDDLSRRDVLHANAVKVLRKSMADKFPMFKAGQILVSPRHLDALVMLDPNSGKVVWGTRGPWRAQHDPTFLENGHLLLFDNLGSPKGSRVLEFDPQTGAFPWTYPGPDDPPFVSRIRGMSQRLPNGNTLIVNSVRGEAFEVTAEREKVWSFSSGGAELYRVRRYTPDQVPFVKGEPRGRP